MKLRNLCTAITITMLCAPFMAQAGLGELKAAVDQAELVFESACEAEKIAPESIKEVAAQIRKDAAEKLMAARAAYKTAQQEADGIATQAAIKAVQMEEVLLQEKEAKKQSGLEELKAAVDQAKKTYQDAFQKASALANVSRTEFYLIPGHQKAAEYAVKEAEKASERLAAAKAAYNAALSEHNADRKQALNRVTAILDAFEEEDDEDEDDVFRPTMTSMTVEDGSLTLTHDNGREEELFGAFEISLQGIHARAIFAGKPAHEAGDNQSDQRRTPRYKQKAPQPITTQFSNEPFDFLAAAKNAEDAAREAARMAMLCAASDHTTTVTPLIAPHVLVEHDERCITQVVRVSGSQVSATPDTECTTTMMRRAAPVMPPAPNYLLTFVEKSAPQKTENSLLEFLTDPNGKTDE